MPCEIERNQTAYTRNSDSEQTAVDESVMNGTISIVELQAILDRILSHPIMPCEIRSDQTTVTGDLEQTTVDMGVIEQPLTGSIPLAVLQAMLEYYLGPEPDRDIEEWVKNVNEQLHGLNENDSRERRNDGYEVAVPEPRTGEDTIAFGQEPQMLEKLGSSSSTSSTPPSRSGSGIIAPPPTPSCSQNFYDRERYPTPPIAHVRRPGQKAVFLKKSKNGSPNSRRNDHDESVVPEPRIDEETLVEISLGPSSSISPTGEPSCSQNFYDRERYLTPPNPAHGVQIQEPTSGGIDFLKTRYPHIFLHEQQDPDAMDGIVMRGVQKTLPVHPETEFHVHEEQ